MATYLSLVNWLETELLDRHLLVCKKLGAAGRDAKYVAERLGWAGRRQVRRGDEERGGGGLGVQ
jgi:hypothetical protein